MLTVFKHTLGRSKGAIIGWGISLAGFAMLMIMFFDSMGADLELFDTLLSAYPPELMAFFGEFSTLSTPEGFLSLEFFAFMPLILGIYALQTGSGLLVSDEESGVLDLIASQPVSRSSLFWGRALSFIFSLTIILILVWVGVMFTTSFYDFGVDGELLAGGLASVGGLLLFFFGFAVLASMLLPSKRSASMSTGILLVAAFFINGLGQINDTLAEISPYFPMHYYQGDTWANGFELNWFLGLVGAGTALILLAWWRFERRDIRVGGEGGFKLRLPKLLQFGRNKA